LTEAARTLQQAARIAGAAYLIAAATAPSTSCSCLCTGASPGSLPFLAKLRQENFVLLKELFEAEKVSPVIDRVVPLSDVPNAVRYVGTRGARG
jgi:hypothetical protein